MPHSNLQQVWPDMADLTPEQQALAALRAEIDGIDDQILALFEQRLAIAATVGIGAILIGLWAPGRDDHQLRLVRRLRTPRSRGRHHV